MAGDMLGVLLLLQLLGMYRGQGRWSNRHTHGDADVKGQDKDRDQDVD